MFPSELFKYCVMTPLQQRVYELGVCAKCHTKSMGFVHAGADMQFWQCKSCKIVAILNDNVAELL